MCGLLKCHMHIRSFALVGQELHHVSGTRRQVLTVAAMTPPEAHRESPLVILPKAYWTYSHGEVPRARRVSLFLLMCTSLSQSSRRHRRFLAIDSGTLQ